jgi:hypothetical protein
MVRTRKGARAREILLRDNYLQAVRPWFKGLRNVSRDFFRVLPRHQHSSGNIARVLTGGTKLLCCAHDWLTEARVLGVSRRLLVSRRYQSFTAPAGGRAHLPVTRPTASKNPVAEIAGRVVNFVHACALANRPVITCGFVVQRAGMAISRAAFSKG